MKPVSDSVQVVVDWHELGGAHVVGTLHVEAARGTPVFSFEYDAAWLRDRRALALDPDLALVRGRTWPRPDQSNFGIFLDSAPDRWGRTLLQRRENWQARQDGRKPRVLREWDFLLGVEDVTRLGALRFRRQPDTVFLAHGDGMPVPPLAHLRELAAVAAAIDRDDGDVSQEEEGRWLRQLVAPGSSLGGARPKAVVRDEAGHLCLAKFPTRQDRFNVGAWEFVLNQLARQAGIAVPEARLLDLAESGSTLLTRRFDRTALGARIPFASAMTLLGRRDGEQGASYLDLAELLMRRGARPAADARALFARVLFNVAVSNTDDHLRNHGFFLTSTGWTLAPAFDLNPNPQGGPHALLLDEVHDEGDLDTVMASHRSFGLPANEATQVCEMVTSAVRGWRRAAVDAGIGKSEIERMAPAFLVAK
ncbi:MAG: type II toxin-antitoxin system HipA family toxin [Deltaproteobacteria bacterium]|nr:type II toxin-antitoxin system HipA family toxin [Deltaproteobacteria bacterium]